MKEIVIISGKGGTGKTTLTAALASLWKNNITADCDVDAADMHLLLNPTVLETHDFFSGVVPEIDAELCTACGLCVESCAFGAISPDIVINRIDCEGCTVCHHVCPVDAVALRERHCGFWYRSDTRFGPLVHAELGIAEENSGKLVTLIKKEAKALAQSVNAETVLVDGSPGIGCPVISSLSGADLVVVVTEPTVSGVHDMDRVLQLAAHFRVPAGVAINKADLNEEASRRIEEKTAAAGAVPLGRIPYDQVFTRAMVDRKTIIEFDRGEAAAAVAGISEAIRSLVRTTED
ncbi:ATP-binding protein [bacterium]|nr:ATP-binding protein [bacterium]